MDDFDLLSPSDKPALLVIRDEQRLTQTRSALETAGYKVHAITSLEQFKNRFHQINYKILVIDEEINKTSEGIAILEYLRTMAMPLRRHATVLLLGDKYETLNPIQAFSQSVNAVVNYSEMEFIDRVIAKTVSENESFLAPYFDVQKSISKAP